jgi:hypothetical protein
MRLKRTRMERAAILLAEDIQSVFQIADSLGVNPKTIHDWKKKPHFRARLEELKAEICARALDEGVSRRERRLTVQNDAHNRLLQIMSERATDPQMQTVPGGKTGLICKTVKGVGMGKDFRVVEIFETDTGMVKALLAIHEQAAKEMGQHVENVNLTVTGLAEQIAEGRKRVAAARNANLIEAPTPSETVQ